MWLYPWVGTSPPDFDEDVPDDLATTDWQLLAAPPPGDPLDMTNSLTDEQRAQFSADGTEWHGESGQYFMIVYPAIPVDFDEDVSLFGPFVLRGPVS